MSNLPGRRIALAITGGIAAYKAAELASTLVQAGAIVDVIMTEAAKEFIQPLTFESITKRPVRTSVFEQWSEESKGHISLAQEADAMIIAPATANSIAKLALGLADDMLTVTHLSASQRGVPIIVGPAMEHHMFHHPATQANIATLQQRGARIVWPEHGRLASGAIGTGRLAPTRQFIGALELALGANGSLAGKRVVVSAGATREPIDPIRILTNRSSGKMGHAIATAALNNGAEVTLITTAEHQSVPVGAVVVRVETALQLRDAVAEHAQGSDALIMAAAVADYRPITVASDKIKKSDGDMSIELTRNPDILATVETPGTLRVGFAAETRDHEENALDKLERKNLDLIVANDARAAMGSDENTVTLYFRDGRRESLETDQKHSVAEALVERIAMLLAGRIS